MHICLCCVSKVFGNAKRANGIKVLGYSTDLIIVAVGMVETLITEMFEHIDYLPVILFLWHRYRVKRLK